MGHYTIWWWSSNNAWDLGNAEYPFIAITPRSTLAPSISIWKIPTIGQIELFDFQTYKWLMLNWIVWNKLFDHLTVCKQMTDAELLEIQGS